MKHVYIVTAGEYSDYHIVACFLTREAARKAFPDTGYYYIEKHRLFDVEPRWPVYEVYMTKEGETFRIYDRGKYGDDCTLKLKTDTNLTFARKFTMRARSITHAVKIANERRVKSIAQGEW